MDWVAGFTWTEWQPSYGLGGRNPWNTHHYTSQALRRYLLRQDTSLQRYAITVQEKLIGAVCIRYPWLRGTCLELIGLEAASQGKGVGCALLRWIERETQMEAQNVWIVVSAFNTKARVFYERQGFLIIGTLKDFVQPGYDEILLRKMLP